MDRELLSRNLTTLLWATIITITQLSATPIKVYSYYQTVPGSDAEYDKERGQLKEAVELHEYKRRHEKEEEA